MWDTCFYRYAESPDGDKKKKKKKKKDKEHKDGKSKSKSKDKDKDKEESSATLEDNVAPTANDSSMFDNWFVFYLFLLPCCRPLPAL